MVSLGSNACVNSGPNINMIAEKKSYQLHVFQILWFDTVLLIKGVFMYKY